MDNFAKRYKYLVKYPLNEEMTISPSFQNNVFEKNDARKSIALEVGVDDENKEQNRINLILQFSNASGYKELVFYFNVTDEENSKTTVVPAAIYDKNIVKRHLPKELLGKNVFRDKINEMFKILIIMEKPDYFFMESYEDFKDYKQISYYEQLIKLITDNGYEIEKQGVNINKKYYWKFVNKVILETEEYKDKIKNEDFIPCRNNVPDYWEKMDELCEASLIRKNAKESTEK